MKYALEACPVTSHYHRQSLHQVGARFYGLHPSFGWGHHHIIVAMDYFTKWAEAMPTVKSDGEIAAQFVFNQIITQFGILKELVTDHGSHFQNRMMEYLASKLGYKQEHSSSYYPQANGQVEAVNKSLKSILQRTIAQSKNNH